MTSERLRAYLVDDEQLALDRLERLLHKYGQIEIVGSTTAPATALRFLTSPTGRDLHVLFLDIQMPGLTGFELLARLPEHPFVIFTTAYDQYALRAFEVNSIDYLLKPVDSDQLDRAIAKLDRFRPVQSASSQHKPDFAALAQQLAATLREQRPEYPSRIATRIGDRITFLDLDLVTHVIASDKLTYAIANGRQHCIDQTLTDLEHRLDPAQFLRIHRAALVNVSWILELNSWFGGKIVLTLKDPQHTQLTVARDRVRMLKSRLGIQLSDG